MAAIDVLSAGALHAIMAELAEMFEQTSGYKVVVKFASSAGVKNRILGGEMADVIITTQAAIHELAGAGKLAPDSVTVVARSPIGLAIREGAPKPDISSVEAFKRALLDAKSIAYADPATGSPSANYLVGLLDRLGLTEALRPKTRLIRSEPGKVVIVSEVVARGEAEIGLQQVSEIVDVAGVALAGLLPDELQHMTIFTAALGAGAKDAEAARAFMAFVTSPQAAPVIAAHGMQAGR